MAALAIEVVLDTIVAVAIELVAAAALHVGRKIVALAIEPVVVAEPFVGRLVDNCPYFLFPSQFSQ